MREETDATKEAAADRGPVLSESFPTDGRRWYNIFPAVNWLRGYQPSRIRLDIAAGITLGAYLLPAGLADASLANLPPEAGLYACLFGGLVFWLFCSSRHTVVSTTTAISVLTGASLGEIAGGDTTRFGALAAETALIVALVAFIAWLVRAGAIVTFISESVMAGFKCGIALFLASTQLPKLFGFHGTHGSFWENSSHFLKHLNETNAASLLIGGIAILLLILGKVFLKNRPVSLVVVIGGIIAASVFSLNNYGVKLLGDVPRGLPAIGLPDVGWNDLNQTLPLAIACFLLGGVETAAVGRMFAAKHGGRFDANQEFLALAASNLAAGIGRGFPISGGSSQSLVNEGAGARTPLSGAFAALIILMVVLFFTHLLSPLPQPVLAAVVLVAIAGLFKLSTLKELWRHDRGEFVVAIAAFLGVLTSGLLRGVLIGAIISLVQLLRRASRPHVAFLGRIPGARRYSDMERHADNEPISGLLLFRTEAGLFYFNADYVRDTVMKRAAEMGPILRLAICDLSTSPYVDLAGAYMLAEMYEELAAMNVRLEIVEARASVRDRLTAEGLEDKVGRIGRFRSLADAVDDFLESNPKT